MKYIMLFLLYVSSCPIFAQATVNISFHPTFGNEALNLNEPLNDDELHIETFKFYISQIELYQEHTKVFAEENSFHLLNAEDSNSLVFSLNIPPNITFTNLKFNIGLDSLTNVSGAFGGDLDPTNGMYWTWQSGFINFKLEGVSKKCPSRHNRFQFHIGGYQQPFDSIQIVELEISDKENIKINLAVDKIFHKINIEEVYQLMSPSKQSFEFSKLLPSLFSIAK